MGDRAGQQFGNYRLVRLLGRGGFAEVYLGEHIHIQTQAAIKILSTQLVAKDFERFLREARTIASFEHQHIVRIFDFGIQAEIPFLVMSYAPHGTLRQRHPEGSRVPLNQVLAYVRQVTPALQYAHERKTIHRDVKPENMLLGSEEEVLLSDFGIAVTTATSTSQQSKTTAGTVAYMAPEQIMGKACTASDQYALGIIVYEWLCGEKPFRGSFFEMCAQHLHAGVPSLRQTHPEISPEVDQCIAKALAKDPAERFASVQDFALALQQSNQQAIYSLTSAPPQLIAPRKLFGSNTAQAAPTLLSPLAVMPVPPELGPNDQTFLNPPSAMPVPLEAGPDAQTVLKSPTGVSSLTEAELNDLAAHATRVEAAYLPNANRSEPMLKDAAPIAYEMPSFIPILPPPSAPNQIQHTDKPGKGNKKIPVLVASVILLALLATTPFLYGILAARVRTTSQPTNIPTQLVVLQSTSTEQPTQLATQQATQPSATSTATSATVERQLSNQQTQSQTASSTKVVTDSATSAAGILRYCGQYPFFTTVNQGATLYNKGHTVQVVVDAPINGKAGTCGTGPAHVVQAGSIGNIPAGDMLQSEGGASYITNDQPFTGGQNAQTYTVVQQSDIDGVSAPLKTTTTQAAKTNIQQQLQTNEHLVGTPQCTSNVTSDHKAGDKANQVTVSVTTTCTATAST